MSAPVLPMPPIPRQPIQAAVYVHAEAPGLGYFVMVFGRPWKWFYHEAAAHSEADVLNDLAAKVVLEGAKKVVKVAQDYAAGQSSTCPDCERTCLDMADEQRKKLLEGA